MSYFEYKGQLEDLKRRKQLIEAEINSHRESLRNALNPITDIDDIPSEYIMELGITLREKCVQHKEYSQKIAVLSREIGA